MRATLKALRKILVFIIGMFVVGLGIVLIPAPGPGLLVIVGGLLILSLEFEWAERYLHRARNELHSITEKVKATKNKNKPSASAKDIDRTSDHKRKGKGRD